MVAKGEQYWSAKFKADIEVVRVAANQSWADIVVRPTNGSKGWRKRQPLVDGKLPFPARQMGSRESA